MFANGTNGPEWDRVDAFTFSLDGKRWAYAAQRGDKWVVVVDGEAGLKYDGIAAPLVFSLDSKRLAYAAMNGNDWFAVVDGKSENVEGRPIFSLDCRHVAYVAKRGDKSVVVLDGDAGPECDTVVKNGPTFGADRVLGYLTVKEDTLFRVKHVPVFSR